MLLLVVAYRWCLPGEVFTNIVYNTSFAINCVTNGNLDDLFDKAYERFPFLKDSIIEKKYNETLYQDISTELIFTIDDYISSNYTVYIPDPNRIQIVLNLRSGNTSIDNNFNINRILDYHLILFTSTINGLCNTQNKTCIFHESDWDPTVGFIYKGIQMSYAHESLYTHVSNRYAPTCLFSNNIGQWKYPQDIDNFFLSHLNLTLGDVSPTEVYLGINDTFKHYDDNRYNLEDMVYMYKMYGSINSSKVNCYAMFNNFICSKVPIRKKQSLNPNSQNYLLIYILFFFSFIIILIIGYIIFKKFIYNNYNDINNQTISV